MLSKYLRAQSAFYVTLYQCECNDGLLSDGLYYYGVLSSGPVFNLSPVPLFFEVLYVCSACTLHRRVIKAKRFWSRF